MFLLSWFDLIRTTVNMIINGVNIKIHSAYTKKDGERLKELDKIFKINSQLYHYILDVYQLDLSKRKFNFVNHNFIVSSLDFEFK